MKKLLLTLGAVASVAAPVAAVVACGTTPAVPHVDEGFNNASLIENFNIADEAATKKVEYQASIDGKKYDLSDQSGKETFIKEWAKEVNTITGLSDFLIGAAPGISAKKAIITGKLQGENVVVDIVDESGSTITKLGLQDGGHKVPLLNFASDVVDARKGGPLVGVDLYTTWVSDKKFIAEGKESTIAPVKDDSIDSILYTLANKLGNTVKTDHDEVSIEGNAPYKRSSGLDFDLNEYNKESDADIAKLPIAANFHKGDKIKFTFDNGTDIASFLERVKYIDSSSAGGGMLKDTLAETKSSIQYKVTGSEDGNGFEVAGFRNDSKWFTLIPTAKNEITLTFTFDINPGVDFTGIILGLTGFKDVNGDGKTDHLDESMTNEFVNDVAKTLSSRYTALAKKATFIYGYTDEANVK